MNDERIKQFDKIVKMKKDVHNALRDYWLEFELYTSLEFWIMVAFLIVPLIYLFFKIDKSKIFLIGFYGYSLHMAIGYLDLFGRNKGFWNYPFPVFPIIPGLTVDSSIIPVTFMLVYQWSLNRNKSFYIYSILTVLSFAFLIKPLMVQLGLFKMYGNTNYLHLFIVYLLAMLAARFITNVFLWMQKRLPRAA